MDDPRYIQSFDAEFYNTSELNITFDSSSGINADFGSVYMVEGCKVLYNTTAFWNDHPQTIAKEGYIYIYSDWKQDGQGKNIAGIKVGDGKAYLIDMPFTDEVWEDHVNDTVRHITEQEREFWNNKVRCYINEGGDGIIFTKD